eukprot:CAMPEP_0171480208 /NCGR_PEP_ID=MMETSP0946-20130122/5918_1 /TAXON_ID=109269 /ORGANISM="Vaucheria litorea, Strain CCMP2940" /LENGTH=434 /DNA_ID=CAMNT_0012011355 /DNA_START=24 /DNA_END=1328 /DNA_ORIENTATION=+
MTQQIWRNRLSREFDGLEKSCEKINGAEIKLVESEMDENDGTCKALFSFVIPLEQAVKTELEKESESAEDKCSVNFSLEFDLDLRTRYPFDPPRVKVVEGGNSLPIGTVSNQILVLPDAEGWTPSNTIIGTLQRLVEHIKAEYARLGQNGETPNDVLAEGFSAGQVVHVDNLRGALFPCRKAGSGILKGAGISPGIYLAVKGQQILELSAHQTTLNVAIVRNVYQITDLAKIRYSRGKSITLVMRGETGDVEDEDEIMYYMNQSYQCMQIITKTLQQLGIPRHQSNSSAEQKVDAAKEVLQKIEDNQKAFADEPTVENVRKIMDLYRQAAELFGVVDDDRAHEVVSKMHAFLQKDDVISILDQKESASIQNPEKSSLTEAIPMLNEKKSEEIELGILSSSITLNNSNDQKASSSKLYEETDDLKQETENVINSL